MQKINLRVAFEPEKLKANAKNEVFLVLKFTSTEQKKPFWCECIVSVKPPLSLTHDRESKPGFTRIGILRPGRHIEKKIKLFTRPNNYPGPYDMTITVYAYDDEGIIAERFEKQEVIECV